MFQILAGILGRTEPEHLFGKLEHYHHFLFLQEFDRSSVCTKYPIHIQSSYTQTGKEWILHL